jgi:hypothetical protein
VELDSSKEAAKDGPIEDHIRGVGTGGFFLLLATGGGGRSDVFVVGVGELDFASGKSLFPPFNSEVWLNTAQFSEGLSRNGFLVSCIVCVRNGFDPSDAD